jgi:sulfoquinovosyltransferase
MARRWPLIMVSKKMPHLLVLALAAQHAAPWPLRGNRRAPSLHASASISPPGPAADVPPTTTTPATTSNRVPTLKSCPPKRIGLLIEPTPFTHVSGYSNRFNEMLKYLSKAGDDVEIVTADDSPKAPEVAFDYPINTIKGFRFPLYNEICLSFDVKQRKVWEVMKRFKPEIIHCTSPGFIVFIAIFTAKTLNIPLVFSYHTHLPMYTKQYVKMLPGAVGEAGAWQIIRWVHNRADLTLVTSPQMKEEMIDNGIQNVEVWRKGVDTEKFDPRFQSAAMREELSDGHPEAPLLIYVGRLGHEKRLRELKQMLKALPEARLALVGKGPAESDLRKHFAGTNTKFMGLMQGERLSQAFASADIFVMPSDSETLGFVVIESMASGVPVVGARAGGIPSIINDGDTGLLANPRDTKDFTAKVKHLIDHPEERKDMAQAAREEMKQWDWEAATSYLRNVQYQKALDNFQSKPVDVIPTSNLAWDIDNRSPLEESDIED